jgi:hypothetical protein
MLCRTPRNFPFGAGVVLINSDGVGNLKVAVDCAIEAGCITGTIKLLRWGFADWANEGHGLSAGCARYLFLAWPIKLKVDPLREAHHLFCGNVFWISGSRRGDDTNRRAFQPRCYGRMQAGTERRVHVKVTGLAVSYAFDFR